DGGGTAARQALDLLEREAAVLGPLAGLDAEAARDHLAQLARAAQRARQVDAHLEMPAALRLLPVHRVEGDDRRDPGKWDLHELRDVLPHGERQPAELTLREPQRR